MKPTRTILLVFAAAIAAASSAFASPTPDGWHIRKIHRADADSIDSVATPDPLVTPELPLAPTPAKKADPAVTDKKPAAPKADFLSIAGEPIITDPEIIAAFVRRNNKTFPVEIADAYLRVGRRYGIRGDIALCQAIIETGWFRFADGTAVTPDQHNYCGMGVTSRGMKGCAFETVEHGATAHIQHLFAYATRSPLPEGEQLLDPRFRLVTRGVAPNWTDLSNRWAMNPNYGNQIIQLFNQLLNYANSK